MYNVDKLDLSHNPIPRVTENSFNGKVNNTRFILLDHCLIQEFNLRHYIELHKLFKLDLSYNLIDKIINIYEANNTDDYMKKFNDHRLQACMIIRTWGHSTTTFNQLPVFLSTFKNIVHTLTTGTVGFEDDEFEGLNLLQNLRLSRNRLTTLGSSLQKLFNLEILRVDSNRLRTLGKEQIPHNLQELYLADNPRSGVHPPNDTALIPPPSNCPPGCRCFCAHDGSEALHVGGLQLPGAHPASRPLQRRQRFRHRKEFHFHYALHQIKYKILYERSRTTIWMNLEIRDEIAGLDVTNNSLQSVEEARLPEGMVHLFLANNQFRVPPMGLLNSQKNL
ncbi:hypothetical protein CEXT_571941 [Caerostris extrusa]|uniref:Uncharacterized protein n=1 Tax=Caerostris extrusa TaxID=172846 RepID=A0AAV4TRZ8_CAEEX|nr:hypothetical protein CEXT_571941 [Caerostris extrusa]